VLRPFAPRHSLEESQNRQGAITGDGAQQLGSSIAAKADPNAWKSHGKIPLEVVSPPKFLKAFCKYIRKSIHVLFYGTKLPALEPIATLAT